MLTKALSDKLQAQLKAHFPPATSHIDKKCPFMLKLFFKNKRVFKASS